MKEDSRVETLKPHIGSSTHLYLLFILDALHKSPSESLDQQCIIKPSLTSCDLCCITRCNCSEAAMTDALRGLNEDLTESVSGLAERLVDLSSSDLSLDDQERAREGAMSHLNKTQNLLQHISSFLCEEGDAPKKAAISSSSSPCVVNPSDIHPSEFQSNPALVGQHLGKEGTCGVTCDSICSIVILVAMEQEARPFIERHNLVENIPSPFEKGSPMLSYSGKISAMSGREVSVHLIWNGRCKIHSCNLVATTAAGVATYAAVQVFCPDLVISAGTAGGFSELGACIGDVYVSTKCIFHARRIPICVPGQKDSHSFKDKYFEEYGFGHFRSPPLSDLAKSIGVKQGIVSSSDCLDCSEIDLQLLRSEGAVVKEMEAAAVAWVCQVLGKPFFALKSITDIVDGSLESEEEFYSNLALASAGLQEKLTLVVQHLGGSALSGAALGTKKAIIPGDGAVQVESRHSQGINNGVEVVAKTDGETLSYVFSVPKGFFQGVCFALVVGACGACGVVWSKRRIS